MKKFDTPVKETSNTDQIHAIFPENNILTMSELQLIRGGHDGDGGGDIIIIPKK